MKLTVLLLTLLPSLALATDPTVTKLHGRATVAQDSYRFGSAVAVSDSYVLVGEPMDAIGGANDIRGAAHLYEAKTGRYLRTLRASDAADGDRFGISVALSGNYALVGAIGDDSLKGAAYLFDVRTGTQLRKLTASDGAASDQFGISVALSGNLALVGAWSDDTFSGSAYVFDTRTGTQVQKLVANDRLTEDVFGFSVALSGTLALVGAQGDDGPGQNSGSAYVFDALTGTQLRKLTASDGAADDNFGISVAQSGNLALVGAKADDTLTGSAYVFDVRTGTQLRKLTASDGVSGELFGYSVALSGNLALVGAVSDDSSRGAVYAFDAATGTQLRKLTASDGMSGDSFGYSVALSGNLAVVGAYRDADLGSDSGSAYFYRGLAGPLPLASVTKKGDFAPGTVEAAFSAFSSVAVNADGEVALAASLSGKGAGKGGSASGLWTTTPGALDLAARGGSSQGNGQVLASVSKPIFNHGSDFLFHAVRKGSTAIDAAILRSVDGATPVPLLEESGTDANLGGAVWNQFYEVAQPPIAGHCAVAFQCKTGPGNVNSFSDTGVCRVSYSTGLLVTLFQEDVDLAGSAQDVFWGQFSPRVAVTDNGMAWSAFLTSNNGVDVTPATNAGVFKEISPGFEMEIARKGATITGTATYSSFLGQTLSPAGQVLHRASLGGPGTTSTNNEGLFLDNTLVVRKGAAAPIPSMTGVFYTMLLKFWAAETGPMITDAIFLAQLKGGGVTAANDVALFHRDSLGVIRILLREGDAVEGTDNPTVGVIQQVDVSAKNGRYVVLASLTGNTAKNQGLFSGMCTNGMTLFSEPGHRRPGLMLRKGTAYQSLAGITSTIKSLTLPNTTDVGGAGAKGGSQVINKDGQGTVIVEFANGAREVLTGEF